MTMSKLKRVKVGSVEQLETWLAGQDRTDQDVMIVTCNKTSKTKHIDRVTLRDAANKHGWVCGRSYTLSGNLVGHVVRPGAETP